MKILRSDPQTHSSVHTTAGGQERVPAPATSRPRPTTKRPDRATPEEQEPSRVPLPIERPSSTRQAGGAATHPRDAAGRFCRRGGGENRSPQRHCPGDTKRRPSGRPSRKRLAEKKRVRLAEAFRARGLDEHEVADKYAVALARLSGDKMGGEEVGVDKALLDTLKVVTNVLEPQRPARERGTAEAPAVVKLIHRVPRPERPKSSGENS